MKLLAIIMDYDNIILIKSYEIIVQLFCELFESDSFWKRLICWYITLYTDKIKWYLKQSRIQIEMRWVYSLKPRVNFTNILWEVFTHEDHKRAKKTGGLTVYFALLESALIKACIKMLGKSSPVVIFINILHAHFSYESLFKAKL